MIDVKVYNREGKEVDTVSVNEEILGGRVRPALLKQAIVMYHANQRQGTAATKSRGMVQGSTRKLYRQKGTGRARVGASRTVVRKGGGVAFAKVNRDFSQRMPKKQRRLARNSAVLAKLLSNDVIVIDRFDFAAPKTKEFTMVLNNLKIERSCLVAIEEYDVNVYKSMRNIPRIKCLEVDQLNAGDVLNKRTLLMTKAALETLVNPAAETVEN
ncbi:MAG: 50S ribosomal protein L4 [Phycisphaerae bacterium]|nr:50S ribosomal protein L4 [Phycisphaerae bacterium]